MCLIDWYLSDINQHRKQLLNGLAHHLFYVYVFFNIVKPVIIVTEHFVYIFLNWQSKHKLLPRVYQTLSVQPPYFQGSFVWKRSLRFMCKQFEPRWLAKGAEKCSIIVCCRIVRTNIDHIKTESIAFSIDFRVRLRCYNWGITYDCCCVWWR